VDQHREPPVVRSILTLKSTPTATLTSKQSASKKSFFSFWFPMSHPCGYSVCSLCRKNTKDLRNIPEAYTGPIFPPTGHFQLQKCCRNCLRFCQAWIHVRFFIQIEICRRKEDFGKFCLFALNIPTPFFSPAMFFLCRLQAMNDPFEELPALPHEELQEVLNGWLRSADSASTDSSTSRLHETYGRRMVDFLRQLPSNSPFRRPLLQVMTVGLRVKVVAEDVGLSQETVYASHRERAAESILLSTAYAPKTKRVRLPQEDLDFAKVFMDEVFPQNSGRDFRGHQHDRRHHLCRLLRILH